MITVLCANLCPLRGPGAVPGVSLTFDSTMLQLKQSAGLRATRGTAVKCNAQAVVGDYINTTVPRIVSALFCQRRSTWLIVYAVIIFEHNQTFGSGLRTAKQLQ